jgi:hypothetical protein
MGSTSAARELRFDKATPIVAPQLAKILPFRRMHPLEAHKAPSCICAQVISMQEAQKAANRNPPQEKKELKDKGHFSKADAALSDAWKLSWIHWASYLDIFSRGGLRVSDEARQVQYYQRLQTGTR